MSCRQEGVVPIVEGLFRTSTVEQASDPKIPSHPDSAPTRQLAAYLSLFRLDHTVKQIFVAPGIVIAASLAHTAFDTALLRRALLGLISVVFVASSNYVLNELLDAPFDRLHPTKWSRPAARGSISKPIAYAQWVASGIIGFLFALAVSKALFFTVLGLWGMGCLYNIPPIRTKDIPYVDVLSESINNPIRFCVGWYIVTSMLVPPVSLLLAYWLLGAYFMALKRFSEYRQIGRQPAMLYRRSFVFYTEQALLTSVFFYAAAAMLFFGAFIMRYRIEMVFSFPLIAVLMAVYFNLAFMEDSPVQNPEKLYRQPRVMVLLSLCCVVLVVTSFVRLPWVGRLFPKSVVHHARSHQIPVSETGVLQKQ
jgi:decaprenyl-phosphate phosphoribosyltransferase